jgi:cytochrome P450
MSEDPPARFRACPAAGAASATSRPCATIRVRDRARERLVELVSEVIRERQALADPPRDLLGILLGLRDGATPRYSPSVITGILISTMFAGHHTSAGTAAWLLVELLRQPALYARVVGEIDALYADGRDVSYQALREIPELENAVKETLRLHPPLIWLPRTALVDFAYEGFVVPKGTIVAMSSALSHEDPECLAEPRRFDPDRFAPPREEDVKHPWAYVPFGGGRHRCLGARALPERARHEAARRRSLRGPLRRPAPRGRADARGVERPRLTEVDGPVAQYRRWYRQFYSDWDGAAGAEQSA